MLTFDKHEKLQQDLAFFEEEIAELQNQKEAALLFDDHLKARAIEADIAEIRETTQRIHRDLQVIELAYAHLIAVEV